MQICLGLAPQSVQRQGSKTSGGKILANVVMMLAGREVQVGRFLTLFETRIKHLCTLLVAGPQVDKTGASQSCRIKPLKCITYKWIFSLIHIYDKWNLI